jgi:hypothetical protein
MDIVCSGGGELGDDFEIGGVGIAHHSAGFRLNPFSVYIRTGLH